MYQLLAKTVLISVGPPSLPVPSSFLPLPIHQLKRVSFSDASRYNPHLFPLNQVSFFIHFDHVIRAVLMVCFNISHTESSQTQQCKISSTTVDFFFKIKQTFYDIYIVYIYIYKFICGDNTVLFLRGGHKVSGSKDSH